MFEFECKRCKKIFDTSKALYTHINLGELPCDLYCNRCGIILPSKSTYRRHMAKSCSFNENLHKRLKKQEQYQHESHNEQQEQPHEQKQP